MTTRVIFSCPPANHKRVRVTPLGKGANGKWIAGHPHILTHGESIEKYVHDGLQFVVDEVD